MTSSSFFIQTSELVAERHLHRAWGMTIEPRQIQRSVQNVRAIVPLRVRTCIEGVEEANVGFESPRPAERHVAPDAHLQIARRLVQHLSLAASRKREAPGGRQRVGLRRAIRQADLAGPEHRIGRRRDEDRPEIAAGLSDVAASDPESLRGKVLAGHPYRVGPVRDAAFAAHAVQALIVTVAEQMTREIAGVVERTRLDEARGARGIPGTVEVLELPR